MLMLTGCPPGPEIPPPSPTTPPKMVLTRAHGSEVRHASITEGPTQLQIDVYQLHVPIGTVSRNEQFWKRIDEQCVDVATCDLLYKNGVRVGAASRGEWDYFKSIMEQHPAITQVSSVVGYDGKPVELPMRKDVTDQRIFYFDSSNQLLGRSFDVSENFIAMTFLPAPRKANTVRIALCPVVRAQRKKLEYSVANEERPEITYTYPERLYDLNLRADISEDQFFVVAPSGESTWPTSLGNNFFIADAAAEKMEVVLLLVPKMVPMDPVTAAMRMPAK